MLQQQLLALAWPDGWHLACRVTLWAGGLCSPATAALRLLRFQGMVRWFHLAVPTSAQHTLPSQLLLHVRMPDRAFLQALPPG